MACFSTEPVASSLPTNPDPAPGLQNKGNNYGCVSQDTKQNMEETAHQSLCKPIVKFTSCFSNPATVYGPELGVSVEE